MKTLSFIGSGNVATHLAKAFFSKGYTIVEICSRTLANAQALAAKVGAKSITNLKMLEKADVYIIAVNDKAINSIVEAMPSTTALVLHTAASEAMHVLRKFDNYGVLYPLQTLHRDGSADMSTVPFLIEADREENLTIVADLAASLSSSIYNMDSAHRRKLHLAAVFAGNFVNSLLAFSKDIAGDDFLLMEPLVRNTVEKAFQAPHPKEVQTGPAIRGDVETINKHLSMLNDRPRLHEAYRLLSTIIIAMTNEQ